MTSSIIALIVGFAAGYGRPVFSSPGWDHHRLLQSLPDLTPLGRDRAQARPHTGRATDPHGHRLFGTSWQSSKEGLNDRWWRTDASLLRCSLHDEGDRASAGVPAFGCCVAANRS